MRQNRHYQIYWQTLYPEKNVMRSTVLQVKGYIWHLLFGDNTVHWVCGAVRTRTGKSTTNAVAVRTEAADAVWTEDTNILSAPSLVRHS